MTKSKLSKLPYNFEQVLNYTASCFLFRNQSGQPYINKLANLINTPEFQKQNFKTNKDALNYLEKVSFKDKTYEIVWASCAGADWKKVMMGQE
jgi:hypothetical protein